MPEELADLGEAASVDEGDLLSCFGCRSCCPFVVWRLLMLLLLYSCEDGDDRASTEIKDFSGRFIKKVGFNRQTPFWKCS